MVIHETYKDPDGSWLFPTEVTRAEGGKWVTVDDQRPVLVGRIEKREVQAEQRRSGSDHRYLWCGYGSAFHAI